MFELCHVEKTKIKRGRDLPTFLKITNMCAAYKAFLKSRPCCFNWIEPIMFVFSGHSGVPLKVRVLQARHQHAETSHVRLIVCRNSPILVCHTATQARPPGTTWPKSVGACGSQRARRSGMRSWTLRKDIMHHPLVIKKQSIPTR